MSGGGKKPENARTTSGEKPKSTQRLSLKVVCCGKEDVAGKNANIESSETIAYGLVEYYCLSPALSLMSPLRPLTAISGVESLSVPLLRSISEASSAYKEYDFHRKIHQKISEFSVDFDGEAYSESYCTEALLRVNVCFRKFESAKRKRELAKEAFVKSFMKLHEDTEFRRCKIVTSCPSSKFLKEIEGNLSHHSKNFECAEEVIDGRDFVAPIIHFENTLVVTENEQVVGASVSSATPPAFPVIIAPSISGSLLSTDSQSSMPGPSESTLEVCYTIHCFLNL